MTAARRKNPWSTTVAFALLIALVAFRYYGDSSEGDDVSTRRPSEITAETSARANVTKQGDYEVISGCRLVDHRNNDGDSFHVRLGTGDEVELRLYFVDAPESRRHQYNGKRIGHQARYFGISDANSVELGVKAKKFVLNELDQNVFTVYTKWQEVYDSGRYYAFVKLKFDGEERWLDEILVDRGLARIYTEGATMPDGESASQRKRTLRLRERAARGTKQGGWAR